ncbi:SCO family protein [uncultured Dokdonia sp.]|uniref:SCO family protein n=1 Tax=uncultured Dokdonia sp. TaxID=575653 RepID=UPI00261C2FD7|nr:SCO family protein [uncultured Dokdonia sp.]
MEEYLGSKEQISAFSWMMSKCNLWSARLIIILSIISCTDTNTTSSRVEILPYYNEVTFTPLWLDASYTTSDTLHTVPPFKLYNQYNDTITQDTFKDKIYVADFFFTFCTGICPKMTKNMASIQQAFIDDPEILLISHSVTPQHDTSEVLQDYASQNGVVKDKWHLVTGSRDEIYDLGRNQYFIEEDLGLNKTEGEFLHTENFVLIDKDKHIRGIYNGLNTTSVQQLIADINTLKKEK